MQDPQIEARPSPVTIIYEERPHAIENAITTDGKLYLELDEMARATGWELKPEGVCLGEMCVPIPAERRADFFLDHGARGDRGGARYFNFAALADLLGKPWAGDLKNRAWFFGTEAAARARALETLKAPDFTLPDLEGKPHSLHDHLGKKVFLVSWASW